MYVVGSKSKCVFAVKAPASKPISLFSGDLCNDLSCLKPSNEKALTQAAESLQSRREEPLLFIVLNRYVRKMCLLLS